MTGYLFFIMGGAYPLCLYVIRSSVTVYYANTHMPLVDKMPNLQRYEAARIVATPDGSEPPYYRIFEGYFEDMEQLGSSLSTPEGQAAANDIPNFATGGATLFFAEVDV
jgi:uncharacterized protein (TIGR02118 family)